jgi:hypothetical protein
MFAPVYIENEGTFIYVFEVDERLFEYATEI